MSVNSINGISSVSKDYEYIRIMKELIALGIQPTGDIRNDRMKLQQAKATQKAQEEATPLQSANQKQNDQIPKNLNQISIKDNSQIQKEQAMSHMTGSSNLAQLNKKLLGL